MSVCRSLDFASRTAIDHREPDDCLCLRDEHDRAFVEALFGMCSITSKHDTEHNARLDLKAANR